MRSNARALGAHLTIVNYDRRSRGDSGDTLAYADEREIEDLAALIEAVGGRTSLYGHSSGAGLVLHAVAAGLPSCTTRRTPPTTRRHPDSLRRRRDDGDRDHLPHSRVDRR
jgi:hypothetical protein